MLDMNSSLLNVQAVGANETIDQPTIYIAGPMTGYPDFNFPAFFEVADAFEEGGWLVHNPAQRDLDMWGSMEGIKEAFEEDREAAIRECLHWDLASICQFCDAIAMLPGWEKSFGAKAEHATAVALGLQIIYLS